MSDQDRLAEILQYREQHYIEPQMLGQLDWLIGEVEDRRTDLAVALSQLQDAVGEIAWLRALLAPTVDMTSPHRINPGTQGSAPPSEG